MPTTNRPRRVTIDDVARAARVSRQTVSRAINDKSEIDPETRRRVLQVAQEMGYRPSRFARGMVRQDVTTLGLIIADVLNPFFPEVVDGVLEAADGRGWQVVVYATGSERAKELAVAEAVPKHVDACVGFILHEEAIRTIASSGIPFAVLDRRGRDLAVAGVDIDFRDGIRQGLDHLTERGHRRIAMIDDRAHALSGAPHARRAAYLAYARDHGLPVGERWIQPADNSTEGGAAAMDALLAEHPDVTAVFAYNDLIAIGAMRQAMKRGREVPGDCAFLGFDGLALGELVDPMLTTLYIDKRRFGKLAVEQVATLMTEPGEVMDAVIRPELVVRRST
ncbi:LacI family DNA-binding transcriptional regulator [Nonomuraea lactucae]|uniref:LacI family DNA-binding transcriptional regulator n=1 Tax=Nonomuraea lactucae TaxID=2249762 RepID=UPI0019665CC2|nr:LacI family DNA-binding transcriptional regulator [Nonomuraea lactucae]